MKRCPLRLQIALWSALVVALAMAVSSIGTAAHFYHEDLEMLDQLLSREIRGVFLELELVPADFDFSQRKLSHRLPAEYQRRHMEIRHDGATVYRSDVPDPDIFGQKSDGPGNYSVGPRGRIRLAIAEKGPWQVRVAYDTNRARDSVFELVRAFLFASPVLLALTALGGWWIARKALAPISAVTQAAEHITAERLHERLPVPPSRDEVQSLSLVLNRMIERLERSFHQARRFSADTSHELRTPVAVVRAGLEAMLSSPGLSPTQEHQLVDLLDATSRLSALTEKLLLLARADAGFLQMEPRGFDVAATLREAIDEAAIFAEPSGLVLTDNLPAHCEIRGDPARLMQVWRNLLENAVKYNRPQGRVTVDLRCDEQSIRLAITNTGPGLAPAEAERLFERFYRAEAHRGTPGHGLGLSISREIVRAQGGDLVVESYEAEKTTFVVTLPRG